MKIFYLAVCIFLLSGCNTIYSIEKSQAEQWKETKLEQTISKYIESGELTESEADKIRKGGYWLLERIIERADRKLKGK